MVKPTTNKDKSKMFTLGPIPSQKGKPQWDKNIPGPSAGSSKPTTQPTVEHKVQPTSGQKGQPIAYHTLDLFRPKLNQSKLDPILASEPKPNSKPNKHKQAAKEEQQLEEQIPILLRPEQYVDNGERPSSTAYLKKARFILSDTMIRPWIVSKESFVSDGQRQILDYVWNHVRAGTMNPAPLRMLEKEFSRINRGTTAVSSSAQKAQNGIWETYHPATAPVEANVQDYDHEARMRQQFYQETVFPSFFYSYNRWMTADKLIQQGDIKGYLSLFGQTLALASEGKISIIRQKSQSNRLVILDLVPNDVFNMSFNYGFVKYVKIISDTQFHDHPVLKQFARFLIQVNIGLEKDIWVKVTSAPPLHQNKPWSNLQDALDRRPQAYPSVHVLREKLPHKADKWIVQKLAAPRPIDPAYQKNQADERVHYLDLIRNLLANYDDEYVCFDGGRIICKSYLSNSMHCSLNQALHAGHLLPPKPEIHDEAVDLDRRETALKSKETQQVQRELEAAKSQMEAVILEFEDHIRSASADQFNSLIRKSESAIGAIVEAHRPSDNYIANRPDNGSYTPQFGEQVYVRGLGDKLATVVEAPGDDETVLVQYGKIKVRVKRSDLRAIPGHESSSATSSVPPERQGRHSRNLRSEAQKENEVSFGPLLQTSKNTIDLRGMRIEEALHQLNMAVSAKEPLSVLFIIHGMGTGVVKERALQILKNHPRVAKFEQESPLNYGCTVAYIK